MTIPRAANQTISPAPLATQITYFCQFPDSIVCTVEMNQLLITLAIVVPLTLGAVWLIFNGIKKMYPMPTKDLD
jgi:heme/copper-type cytochrome/quinol oxidase subunit 4